MLKNPGCGHSEPADVWRVKNLLLLLNAANCRFLGPGIVRWKIPVLRMTPGGKFVSMLRMTLEDSFSTNS
jgi:hypothetical protein